MTRPTTRALLGLAAALAIGCAACGPALGPAQESAPASEPPVSQSPAGPDASMASEGPLGSNQPGESSVAGGQTGGQIGGSWRPAPILLGDSQIAIVSDACAAEARKSLGEDEANLPTAVVDARGQGLVTAILADDVQAVMCLARLDDAGAATVDSVDRLATTSFDPQDGSKIGVTELIGLDDPPGARTLAFGRVGPDPAQVKLGLDDQSTLVASRDNGWWLAWWPGAQRASSIAGVDTNGAEVGSADAPKGEVESRLGPASWWLDPTATAPGPDATILAIKVLEQACASGGAGGADRLDPPTIDLSDTSIVVTLAMRRQPGAQDCQGNAPFSFNLDLPEPLGDRALLDGSENPPRDVSKPPTG